MFTKDIGGPNIEAEESRWNKQTSAPVCCSTPLRDRGQDAGNETDPLAISCVVEIPPKGKIEALDNASASTYAAVIRELDCAGTRSAASKEAG